MREESSNVVATIQDDVGVLLLPFCYRMAPKHAGKPCIADYRERRA